MVKVFIIDDSALVRAFLMEILLTDSELKLVGQAIDAHFAMKKIKKLEPDIILLDVDMPKMNGLDFLKQLMLEFPTPVIMFSSLTQEDSEVTLKALELGALDFVAKPQENLTKNLNIVKSEIIGKIKSLSQVKIKELITKKSELIIKKKYDPLEEKSNYAKNKIDKNIEILSKLKKSEKVIVIGASTGGTRALVQILKNMPKYSPPIVVVQHMPPVFTRQFAENSDKLCTINVVEAKNRDVLVNGKVYIAPGGYHTIIKKGSVGYFIQVLEGQVVNHHRPSVDVLFKSASITLKGNAIGVILTGMGDDGAKGMKLMRDAGAYNIAQNKDTCVVFGMPKEAIAEKGVDIILPLSKIAEHILKKI